MNHGFAVDQATLPEGATQTHISLFDGSNCGIELKGKRCSRCSTTPRPRRAARLALSVQAIADLMRENKRA